MSGRVHNGVAGFARSRLAVALVMVLALAGCATQPPILPSGTAPVVLSSTPFFPQQRYQCGPAALAMALQAAGINVRPSELVDKVYIPERQGSLQMEMIAAARRYGRIPYVVESNLQALIAELRGGRPVLVLLNLGWDFYPVWHYAVVFGYRPERDVFLLHSGTERRKVIEVADFLDNWRKAGSWGVVLLRPGELPAGGDVHRYLRAVAGMEAFGALEAAATGYRAAIRRWPAAATAWVGLGNVAYARGNLEAAANAFRQALKRKLGLAAARNNLARVLAERGCRTAALKQIREALGDAPPGLQASISATRAEIQAMPDSNGGCQSPGGLR